MFQFHRNKVRAPEGGDIYRREDALGDDRLFSPLLIPDRHTGQVENP